MAQDEHQMHRIDLSVDLAAEQCERTAIALLDVRPEGITVIAVKSIGSHIEEATVRSLLEDALKNHNV